MSARSWIGLLAASALAVSAQNALAERKCEQKTQTCIDTRTGITRVCVITICTEDGTIISTDVIVLKDAPVAETGGTSGPKNPKAAAPKIKGTTVLKQ